MNSYVKKALSCSVSISFSMIALGLPAAHAADLQTIKVGINGDIRSTEPGVNREENSDALVMHLVEGLVAYREDASIGPMLAQKVDVSADGLSYTFTLRDGVKFQNGKTLKSADVKWTWQRYLDPKTQWRCLSDFDGRGIAKILGIDTPSPNTVVFRLDQPNSLFTASMARADCGGSGIYHADSLAADGSWKAPIGTGPFTLGDWKRGQYIELDRFKDYTPRSEAGPDGYTGNKLAKVDKVRFLIVPDNASAKAALLSRGIDLLPDVTGTDAAELQRVAGLKVQTSQVMTINGLLFQTRDPLLKDVRIRRALALALDYTQMVAVLSNGLSKANNSAIPNTSPYYKQVASQGYKPNIDEARRLLREAGYKGQPIKMIVNKRYPQMFDMGVLSQAMAESIGMKIELETLEWGTQLERYQSGNYQTMAFSYSPRFDAALSFESILGDKAKETRKVWDNPAAVTLMRQAMQESDPAKRQAILDQLHTMMIEDVPMIVLYNGTNIAALRDRLDGYRSWPIAKPRLWGVSIADASK
ncbi:ABC transporter substrate-binding protein [Pigmentiphaga aceris]|uniref:ABC transporter substrate-binding protein n=1 Tax=Pigmentiphaga aceris TaxID=1940612 RepID=A0A5C0B0F0_9BURK|nr:ABC transporter substrate-binding protein [Pigmentiphaga aceris]QEI06590.1 ABC transporter substrate-binding protein [Pigmentiphaga aceris]